MNIEIVSRTFAFIAARVPANNGMQYAKVRTTRAGNQLSIA
jgi:hypothetical protein